MRLVLIIWVLLPNCFYGQLNASFYTYFGSQEDEVGYSIVQTMNKGYFVLGISNGNGALQTDILLSRLDNSGAPIWHKLYGGMNNECGTAVVELSDSSLVFTGYTNSYGSGGYDAIIYRVDKLGNLLWQKTFGGLDWDFANSLVLSNDNHLVVCGSTYSFGRGLMDGFILKLDLNGNQVWSKFYGGLEDDEFMRVIQTNDGGYVLAGTTKSYGDSLGNAWIFKVNATGDSLWQTQYGGSGPDVGNSVVENTAGELFVAGGVTPTNSPKTEAFVVKLTNTSAFVWETLMGLPQENEVANDVLVSGSSYGNVLMTYATREIGGFGDDVKTLLLDANGYYLQGGSFGGQYDDVGHDLAGTEDKGYILCGATESYNALAKDVLIIKYDSLMGIGPVVVSLNEKNADEVAYKVYPTLITTNQFSIEFDETNGTPQIELTNLMGQKIKPSKIERDSGKLIVFLPEEVKGLFLVSIDKGKKVFRCVKP